MISGKRLIEKFLTIESIEQSLEERFIFCILENKTNLFLMNDQTRTIKNRVNNYALYG